MPPHAKSEDLEYLLHAENISRDYTDFIKNTVLPQFKKQYLLKLREIRVLHAIACSESAPYASHLSTLLRQDPATITRSLIVLIDNGYVVSEEDSKDARSKLLKTTAKGSEAAKHFLDVFNKMVQTAINTAGPDRFDQNHTALSQCLKSLAARAKAFKESQSMIHRAFKS